MNWKVFFSTCVSAFIVCFPQNIISCGPEADPYDYYTSFFHQQLPDASGYRPFYYTGYNFLYDSQEPVAVPDLLAEATVADLHVSALADLVYASVARYVRYGFGCLAVTDPASGVVTWASKTRSYAGEPSNGEESRGPARRASHVRSLERATWEGSTTGRSEGSGSAGSGMGFRGRRNSSVSTPSGEDLASVLRRLYTTAGPVSSTAVRPSGSIAGAVNIRWVVGTPEAVSTGLERILACRPAMARLPCVEVEF